MSIKLFDYISFAIEVFLESLKTRFHRLKFIQLMNCLELSLSASGQISGNYVIARHAALLLSVDREQFIAYYDELTMLSCFKTELISGMPADDEWGEGNSELIQKTKRLEELVRGTLKAMVKLNLKDKDLLFRTLNVKSF